MRAGDYAARRDLFTTALNALRDVEVEFIETIDSFEGVRDADDVADQLDAEGKVLTGDEYRQLLDGIALMERLVGRAHASAVALERYGA